MSEFPQTAQSVTAVQADPRSDLLRFLPMPKDNLH